MELFSLVKGANGRRNSYSAEELLLIEEGKSKGLTGEKLCKWVASQCKERFGATVKVRSEASLNYVLTRKYQEFVQQLHKEHVEREKSGTENAEQEAIYQRMLTVNSKGSRIEMCKFFIEIMQVPSVTTPASETL